MNKNSLFTFLLVSIVGGLFVLWDGLYVVPVDRYAIVIEFGAPKRVLDEPGLYFKTPVVQQVVFIDKRILSWDDQPQEVITVDKKRIYINSFARWKISDALKYYTAVRDDSVAQMNLDKLLGGNIREVVSQNLLDTLVRDTNRDLTYTSQESERERATVKLDEGKGRTAIFRAIVELSKQELLDTFGIALIDVDIKQLNYTKSAQDATIRQMISEREKVAAAYEAEGLMESDTIAGETQEQVLSLVGLATREKLRIEGEARAEASAIKSNAFGQDPEVFNFLETLALYEGSLSKKTTLYLSTDSALLSLLEGVGAPRKVNVKSKDLEGMIQQLKKQGAADIVPPTPTMGREGQKGEEKAETKSPTPTEEPASPAPEEPSDEAAPTDGDAAPAEAVE